MKITAKEIDLLVDSMMDNVYDRNYVNNEKRKLATEEREKIKEIPELQEFMKLFDNQFVSYIQPNQKFYAMIGTPSCNYYHQFQSAQDLENSIISHLMGNYKVEYPNERDVKRELKSLLVVECLGGDDLKSVLTEVTKAIKAKFNLS